MNGWPALPHRLRRLRGRLAAGALGLALTAVSAPARQVAVTILNTTDLHGSIRRTPGTYIMSGRDCWHGKCTFCSWTTLYPNYRVRTPESVVDEIGELIERYGVREIMDDTGSLPAGAWLRTFCEEMIARGYNKRVKIDCNMRFGCLDAETYRLMKRAGFRLVLFGLESANQPTLVSAITSITTPRHVIFVHPLIGQSSTFCFFRL